MSPIRASVFSIVAVTVVLTLGSAFACMHEYMPEQLSSHPGLYSSVFVLIP